MLSSCRTGAAMASVSPASCMTSRLTVCSRSSGSRIPRRRASSSSPTYLARTCGASASSTGPVLAVRSASRSSFSPSLPLINDSYSPSRTRSSRLNAQSVTPARRGGTFLVSVALSAVLGRSIVVASTTSPTARRQTVAADWSALTSYLRGQPETVTVSWRELEDVVGGMPASAIDYAAWWGGDRPHTRAWKAAGYEVLRRSPGASVTFRRVSAARARPSVLPSAHRPEPEELVRTAPSNGRVVLVSCAKSKLSVPAAAKDLYSSARFRKARAYAEGLGDPWFILSAEHGLVAPDEWLAPYERYLPETPRPYRTAWGEWVVARLDLLLGDELSGCLIELHAGEDYVSPLLAPLERRGVTVARPLQGLTSGRWQGWYDAQSRDDEPVLDPDAATFDGDAAPIVAKLSDPDAAYTSAELAALERLRLDGPGLYSWFVDGQGAEDLSRGLAHAVTPGLVYVGQTGATKWPSGKASNSTLLKRLRRQHLRGRRSASTLRKTLGGVLDAAFGQVVIREELSEWMAEHMRVVPLLVDDANSLGDLERQVVQALNPPLNLEHASSEALRVELRRLRALGEAHGVE